MTKTKLQKFFDQAEDRDSFFARVHRFTLPYHEGALLIAKAYETSKNAFRGVKRKRGERYFEHCRMVAVILMDIVKVADVDLVIAALLHDVVEDVDGWNLARIETEFGPRVSALVGAVTMPAGSFPDRDARIHAFHEQISNGPDGAWKIKLADRLHNLSTASSLSGEAQRRMIDETRKIYLGRAETANILHRELREVIALREKELTQ